MRTLRPVENFAHQTVVWTHYTLLSPEGAFRAAARRITRQRRQPRRHGEHRRGRPREVL